MSQNVFTCVAFFKDETATAEAYRQYWNARCDHTRFLGFLLVQPGQDNATFRPGKIEPKKAVVFPIVNSVPPQEFVDLSLTELLLLSITPREALNMLCANQVAQLRELALPAEQVFALHRTPILSLPRRELTTQIKNPR